MGHLTPTFGTGGFPSLFGVAPAPLLLSVLAASGRSAGPTLAPSRLCDQITERHEIALAG
jgi:hypothetical protein